MRKLEKNLHDLNRVLQRSGVPRWDSEYLIEDFYIQPGSVQTVERYRLYTPAEFVDRFDTLLAEGYNWINLSGLGLLAGSLIIAVEKPELYSHSPETAINFSAPPRCVEDNGFKLEKFLRINKQE